MNAKYDDEFVLSLVKDGGRQEATASGALRLLAANQSPNLRKAIDFALSSEHWRLRAIGRDVLAKVEAKKAVELIHDVVESNKSPIAERQASLSTLAGMKSAKADQMILDWANRLAADEVEPGLQLDVIDACRSRKQPEIQQALKKFESAQSKKQFKKVEIALHGGDAVRGRQIFRGHNQAQCVRCHKVDGFGGTAGPDLSTVVSRNPKDSRRHLLQSMIHPNAKIAPGFGSITVALDDGKVIAGVLKKETAESLTIVEPSGKKTTIRVAQIDDRTEPKSLMPSVENILSPRELRDLVEYLASRK